MHRAATYLPFIQENFKPHRPETDWPFITFELRTDFPSKGSIILLGLFAFYDFRRCHGNLGNKPKLRLFHVLNFKLWIVVCNFNQSGSLKITLLYLLLKNIYGRQVIRADIWQHGSDSCLVLSIGGQGVILGSMRFLAFLESLID